MQAITVGKLALKYSGSNIEAMKAIAKASHNRSLHAFQESLKTYKTELIDDPIINAHLKSLYDTMLEQNLCRIIEPYSRVQVCPFHKMSFVILITWFIASGCAHRLFDQFAY